MAEWYTKIAEQVVGPLSADQLRALADGGRLAPNDPIARSKAGPWVPASRVKGLFETAAVDAGSEQELAAPRPAAEKVPPPVKEPPIPQPPVVMPGQKVASETVSISPPSGPGEVVPPIQDSGQGSGFAIQTEEVAPSQRRHSHKRKREKKPREPLTKKQKNVRLVKWLAVAVVAAIAVFAAIPFVRRLVQPAPEPVATSNPVVADVDVAAADDGLEEAFNTSSQPARPRSRPSAPQGRGNSTAGRQVEPMEETPEGAISGDTVDVKKAGYFLDRPLMSSADGRTARPANLFLLVKLELTAKNPDATPRFRGWINYAKEISLTDNNGVEYKVRTPQNFGGMYVDGQCHEMVFLSAEKPTTDVIVFAWPEDEGPVLPSNSDASLYLRLPKAAFGEQDELKIAIPLSEIEVTEEALKRSLEKPTAEKAATSDNVETDDGGPIRIPGLTDKP
ncbi:MAG: DUF4339 domain-containing protein [Planctomycetaceae bacterium]|jgi:hypothetical protein|nr:DUF4339 domain-containing protein [Planctomycetaceae bacterium]